MADQNKVTTDRKGLEISISLVKTQKKYLQNWFIYSSIVKNIFNLFQITKF